MSPEKPRPRARRCGIEFEEERAWVGFYKRVGRDPAIAAEVMALFTELPAQGTCVLVASHDLHQVRRLRRRVLVLDHGRLIDDYRPEAA